MHRGVLEEDPGGDLLFEFGAGQEMVIHSVDFARARRARGASDHASDGLRVGIRQAATQGRLPAPGGT